MFNRVRFCFLNETPWSDPDKFYAPRKRPELFSAGVELEATLCSDGVWRVLECETRKQIEKVIYL